MNYEDLKEVIKMILPDHLTNLIIKYLKLFDLREQQENQMYYGWMDLFSDSYLESPHHN